MFAIGCPGAARDGLLEATLIGWDAGIDEERGKGKGGRRRGEVRAVSKIRMIVVPLFYSATLPLIHESNVS